MCVYIESVILLTIADDGNFDQREDGWNICAPGMSLVALCSIQLTKPNILLFARYGWSLVIPRIYQILKDNT